MAEEKLDAREMTWRHLFPWTELFRGFQVALDLNKLLLAAAGILVMSLGWWLLSLIFAAHLDSRPPAWPAGYLKETEGDENKAWAHFKADRDHWNLMYETANLKGEHSHRFEIEDLAGTLPEYNLVRTTFRDFNKTHDRPEDSIPREYPDLIGQLVRDKKLTEQQGRLYLNKLDHYKPAARLSSWPWVENRGPNPYLLVTGQAGIPWETGHFWDWFLRDQLLVMIEPLVKLVLPVIYFFNARSDFVSSLYFLLVLLWTLATWAIFGGAITRIAAVQVARGEKLGLSEAMRFTFKRILSYLMAPLCPLIGVFFILVIMIIFGLVQMIPIFGDIFVDGLFWPIMVLLGLGMAVLLVGLLGWPLMSCTISAEGTDSWEAVTRAYSYVYQKPWHYLWYSLVAIAYGSVLVFFVGLMGSLMVYLAKWGIQQTPFINMANREPSFLFVHAPDSFGWRTLLLEGATVNGQKIVDNGQINAGLYNDYVGTNTTYEGRDQMRGWNHVGAWMVAFWLGLVFLLVLGFGYSYFWSASTIIYLLMRRNLDAAELDEVYLEEDEHDGAFGTGIPPAPSAPASKPGMMGGPTMVAPPTLKTPSSSSPITAPPLPREKPPEAPPAAPPAPVLSTPPAPPAPPPLSLPTPVERPAPEPSPPPVVEKPTTMIEPTPPPLLPPEPTHPPEDEAPPRGPDTPL